MWVGGTKAGLIKYIGATKFAPGNWVGVELDEAQGKNDGSVAGETYFHCPPNHGVFSRLNRLSRKQSVVAAAEKLPIACRPSPECAQACT